MKILIGLLGLLLTGVVLLDAFETIVLPRRVSRRMRLTRYFYRYTWKPWLRIGRLFRGSRNRESYLAFYGPLSLILLLILWAGGLIFSFALLHWAADPDPAARFAEKLYRSGNVFFTLGPGDGAPHGPLAKALTVIQAGVGLGFLAIVIGYLPVIYQSFSRREVSISMLDARAGSPPTAAELLRRHAYDHGMESLRELLRDWEHWSADLLESHLSYSVLAYFRSQHSNQSWLAALTVILDASALVMCGVSNANPDRKGAECIPGAPPAATPDSGASGGEWLREGACRRQAELTFAMARHAVVDLSQVFGTPPGLREEERLSAEGLRRLRMQLAAAGVQLDAAADARLQELRRLYEPYVSSLSAYLSLALPLWLPDGSRKDNWQTSSWENLRDATRRRSEPAPKQGRT